MKNDKTETPEIAMTGLPPQVELELGDIIVNPEKNLRRYQDDAKSTEALSRDIVTTGQIQPVVVRRIPDQPDKYELVAGFRRYAAIAHANENGHKVRVLARVLDTDDHGAQMVNLKENIKRKNLSYMDMSYAIGQLRQGGMTTKEVAAEFGRDEGWVRIVDKLSTLKPEIQKAIHKGEIPFPVARTLVNTDEATQEKILAASKAAAEVGTNVQKAALDAKKKAGAAKKGGKGKAKQGKVSGGVSAKQALLEIGEEVKAIRELEKPGKADTKAAATMDLFTKYLTGKFKVGGLRTKIAEVIA